MAEALVWQRNAPWVLPATTGLGLLALWQGAAALKLLPIIVPGPVAVLGELTENFPIFWANLVPTALTAFAGFCAALVIALLTALIVQRVRAWETTALTLGSAIDSIPLIALAPAFTIWFGVALPTRILLATIVCLFPLLASGLRGLHAPSAVTQELFRVLAASSWQRFRLLTLPAALPFWFHGMKTAAPLAVLGALVGEWTGAETGLGVQMTSAMLNLDILTLWGAVVTTCVFAALCYGVLALIEQFLPATRSGAAHE